LRKKKGFLGRAFESSAMWSLAGLICQYGDGGCRRRFFGGEVAWGGSIRIVAAYAYDLAAIGFDGCHC